MLNNNNYFKHYSSLNSSNAADFNKKLMEVALSGKHEEIGLLNNIAEYNVAKTLLRAQKKIKKAYKKSWMISYNEYVDNLKKGFDNLQLLADCKAFQTCEKYFEVECKELADKMDEFEFYMIKGHFLEMFFGNERLYKDMHDFRKKA